MPSRNEATAVHRNSSGWTVDTHKNPRLTRALEALKAEGRQTTGLNSKEAKALADEINRRAERDNAPLHSRGG